MRTKTLTYSTKVERPLAIVFDFFSQAENLNKLTPPNLNFEIKTKMPIPMFKGQTIDYRIRLFGIPFNWRTEICEWDAPNKFADKQLIGPYAIWEHQHIFEERGNTTYMTDIIVYESKGWIFAPFLHWLFVDKNVKEIFAFREKQLNEIFPTNKIN
jgi:ligand-binding SRPBCC domain-containing protein